jgi:prevent-host-death family protein
MRVLLTWPRSYGYIKCVKTINAGQFKNLCLKIMDGVARTKTPIVVTKRGRPIIKVVPYAETSNSSQSLVGSILKETGTPFGTDEKWDADLS